MEFRVKQLRQNKKWSQKRLSHESGVSRPIISKLESGKEVIVKSSTLTALANALGCTVLSLYGQNV